uniref:uncharacterized protein LOC120334351 isoform X5 n=1 Tax=Styela clava TaxID=7725 RepID=UPI00193A1AA5|nr:uncharacterized protein LOC120334351 isoform X5 [Styela clava]
MFFTKIILATLLLSAAIAFEQKCFFPEPARDFDAYKLHGTTWYTGLQTNDAVAANIKCERAGNFTETSTGFQTDFRTFKKSNEHIDWVAHFTFLRSAVYQESKVKDVENVLLERDFAFISDYLNYCMGILCSAEGQWIVWIYFQTKTPSLTNIAAAYNELQRLGVSTQLYASQCKRHTELYKDSDHGRKIDLS